MKKIIIITIIIVAILFVAIIGSVIVSSNKEVSQKEDIMLVQKNLEKSYSCYGYTIDNPKIVINPYEIAPISALIMFNTSEDIKVRVYVNDVFLYEESDEKREHYLDIYNLKMDNNEVKLVVDNKEYNYNVVIDKIELDLPTVVVDNDEIGFVEINSSLGGINKNNELVYYFEGFSNKIKQLDNGHFLITSSRKNNDGSYISFSEIDMVGRIYNDYVISDGFQGLVYPLENGNYLVLANNILEIDRQNGSVVREFIIEQDDEWVNLIYKDDEVILIGKNKTLYYDYDSDNVEVINKKEVDISNNITVKVGNFYRNFVQNRFGESSETVTSNLGVNLLFYKKIDDNYNKYKINFVKEFDRLVVSKDNDETIYIILDKFGQKLVYEMNDNIFYINDANLSGKYDIYVKISDKVYKTDYYVVVK